jgi:predicted enzyme related to lactoylglutathione lyase
MSIHTFTRFDLRTTDPDAARRFYAAAIGLDLDADPATLAVWPLHEQARARGAPAHWLGNIGVADLDATVRRLRELGAESLGPPVLKGADGVSFAILRDPLGAVLAVREGDALERSPVAWHQLSTTQVDRAWAIYSELFGWAGAEVVDMAGLETKNHPFAWQAGGEVVGGMANTARLAGVHTHWLYFFPVVDLDDAITKVRANGGSALTPFVLPNGDRLAAAEDPQGAAFGILQATRS